MKFSIRRLFCVSQAALCIALGGCSTMDTISPGTAVAEVGPRYTVCHDRERASLEIRELISGDPSEWERCYLIPDEAARFLSEVDVGTLLDTLSIRLHATVTADAAWALLSEGSGAGRKDFVSDYDFWSGSLDDLPFQIVAEVGITGAQWFRFIERIAAEGHVLSAFEFPVLWTVDSNYEFVLHEEPPFHAKDSDSARFIDGKISGAIAIEDGLLAIVPPDMTDDDAFPLEVIIRRVAFGDVDGDGYLDAILRLSVNGWGLVAVLSRKTADQRGFSWIQFYFGTGMALD